MRGASVKREPKKKTHNAWFAIIRGNCIFGRCVWAWMRVRSATKSICDWPRMMQLNGRQSTVLMIARWFCSCFCCCYFNFWRLKANTLNAGVYQCLNQIHSYCNVEHVQLNKYLLCCVPTQIDVIRLEAATQNGSPSTLERNKRWTINCYICSSYALSFVMYTISSYK